MLTLLALGEVRSTGDGAHLETCAVCRQRLDELQRVVTIGRSLERADSEPAAPPPEVWDGIRAELVLGADDAPAVPRRVAVRRRVVAVAVAAGLAITIGVVALWTTIGREEPSPPLIAEARLEPVTGGGVRGRGDAALHRGPEGPELEVTLPTLPSAPDAYYELWLIDGRTDEIVSLGPIEDGPTASHALPAGLDTKRFWIVDVSLEPLDGEPSHSGNSVLRGPLDA